MTKYYAPWPIYGKDRIDYHDASEGWTAEATWWISDDGKTCHVLVDTDIREPLLKELYNKKYAIILISLSAHVSHVLTKMSVEDLGSGEITLPVSAFTDLEEQGYCSVEIVSIQDFRLYMRVGADGTEASFDNVQWFACGVEEGFIPACGYIDIPKRKILAESIDFQLPAIEKGYIGGNSIVEFRKSEYAGRPYLDLENSDKVIWYIDAPQYEAHEKDNNADPKGFSKMILNLFIYRLCAELSEKIDECSDTLWYRRFNELLTSKGLPPFEEQVEKGWINYIEADAWQLIGKETFDGKAA